MQLTVTELKLLLNITDTTKDNYLTAMLPNLIDWAQDYCNRTFDVVPGGVRIALAKMAQYHLQQAGVQSESLGDYSVTLTTDYPESVLKLLKPYRRVKFI